MFDLDSCQCKLLLFDAPLPSFILRDWVQVGFLWDTQCEAKSREGWGGHFK